MIAAFLFAYGCCLAPCIIGNTDYKFDETYVRAPGRQLAVSFCSRFIFWEILHSVFFVRSNMATSRQLQIPPLRFGRDDKGRTVALRNSSESDGQDWERLFRGNRRSLRCASVGSG